MAYEMDVLPWVILANYILTFCMTSSSFILSLMLLYNSQRYKTIIKFTPTINLYFCCVFIVSIIVVANMIYLISLWRIHEVIYDAKVLYIMGAATAQFLAAIPVIEFFTCVDRCLCILYPLHATTKLSYITSSLSLIIITFILISYNVTNDILTYFPLETKTQCRTFGCQKTSTANLNTAMMKSIIAVFNVLVALLLGYLVKTRVSASMTIQRVNTVVLRMSIATIILDFFPNLAAFIGLLVGSKLLNIFGPYSATLTSTNMAITTMMYWKTLQRSIQEKSKTSIVYFKSAVN